MERIKVVFSVERCRKDGSEPFVELIEKSQTIIELGVFPLEEACRAAGINIGRFLSLKLPDALAAAKD